MEKMVVCEVSERKDMRFGKTDKKCGEKQNRN